MKNTYVIIPTLNPDEKIMSEFMDELKKSFTNIIVINDGSAKIHDKYFEKLAKEHIIVLKHAINLGKGRALKNAFNYVLNNYGDDALVVTCDCDGQHKVKDIIACSKVLEKNKDCLILGTRDFKKDNVPFKSRYGNIITRNVISNFVGINITDTQTGLRALSGKLIKKILELDGERYEYETNVLIECQKQNIPIKEVIIDTVYLNQNAGSHFNPLKDSYKIYRLFFKYLIPTFILFVLNILIFGVFLKYSSLNIILITFISRFITLILEFLLPTRIKFLNKSFSKIILLLIIIMLSTLISGISLYYLSFVFCRSLILYKIIIDLLLGIITMFLKGKLKI